MSYSCKGRSRYTTVLRGVCSLPGSLQKDPWALGSTGKGQSVQAVGLLKGLRCPLQGLGWGRKMWNRLQKAKTLEYQVTYGDALSVELLC